jgi:hypothetical protein
MCATFPTKVATWFLSEEQTVIGKKRAASPQPFMFQYRRLPPNTRLHFMHAAPIRVENSEIARTLVKPGEKL